MSTENLWKTSEKTPETENLSRTSLRFSRGLKTSCTLSNFKVPFQQLTNNEHKSILWSRVLQSDIGEQSELGMPQVMIPLSPACDDQWKPVTPANLLRIIRSHVKSNFIPWNNIGVLWYYLSGCYISRRFSKGFWKPRAGRHISYMSDHQKPEVFQRFFRGFWF